MSARNTLICAAAGCTEQSAPFDKKSGERPGGSTDAAGHWVCSEHAPQPTMPDPVPSQPASKYVETSRAIVETRLEDTGEVVGRQIMDTNADYVVIVGPDYFVAHENHFANGTTTLTIKRKADDE